MHFAIAETADRSLWTAAMADAEATDVYYLPEYHQLYGFRGGRCLAYIAKGGGETLFHPFFLRPVGCVGSVEVSPRLHDIETVYGFTGPIATTDCPEFLKEAWRGFDIWCRENCVVAEFVRFHPLLRTQRFAAPQADVSLDRESVVVHVGGDEERLWHSYSSPQRNRVRKAMKIGLTCQEGDLEKHLKIFVHMYEATMQRRGAAAFYRFPQTYYDLIRRTLADKTRLFFVEHQGMVVAGALFFVVGRTVHYHLGGSRAEAQQFAPNNLLFHHVAVWAQRHGFAYLHLGGGRTSAANDLLLRFKRRFSRHSVPFYLGKRVHDEEQYDTLCKLFVEQHGERVPSYFPVYRARIQQHIPREDAA